VKKTMLSIIKNEIIKLYHRKKFIFCSIILILLLVATYWDFTNQIGDAAYRSDKKVLKYYEDQIKTTKDSSDAKDINQHIDQLKAMIKSYDEYKVNPKAWKERLKNEIKGLENTKSGNESALSKEMNFEQLNYDKYLLQNNFKPQQDFVATSFEFNDAYLQIIGIFVIIIFIIVAIMTSDIISSEYTPPTIKFLLLRPVSEWKLIVGKFLACAVSVCAIIATCDMVVYIFGGIKYGFTNLMYPVSIGPKFKYSSIMDVHLKQFISVIPNTSTVVPYYKFLLEVLILQFVYIIACASFCTLISCIIKNNSAAVAVTILLSVILLVISKLPSFQKVSNIMGGVFIFLGDSNAIISRSFVQQYGASYIGTMSAVIIMLIWTGVFMGLSLLTTRFSWK
jgi:ABC-2 type transport system permease protein